MNKIRVIIAVSFICLAVCAVLFEVFIWCKYGAMPITEIPAWVVFFMLGK